MYRSRNSLTVPYAEHWKLFLRYSVTQSVLKTLYNLPLDTVFHMGQDWPDLNPIEMAWSKVKQSLRKAQARTVEALYEAIAQALQTLSPTDAKGFFKHVGF